MNTTTTRPELSELSGLAEEMLVLESETFEIEDYSGAQDMGDAACSSSSTCSSSCCA